ncbi:hypothetical protein B296_00041690, partial [Ensete ventricosum]
MEVGIAPVRLLRVADKCCRRLGRREGGREGGQGVVADKCCRRLGRREGGREGGQGVRQSISRNVSDERLPREGGILPVRLLSWRLRITSLRSAPVSAGISPVRLFEPRRSDSRWSRLPSSGWSWPC